MKFMSIEGNFQRLDGGSMYGNAPREVWQRWSPPDDHHRILLACRALFWETDEGRRFLFETGIGTFFHPKLRDRFGVTPPDRHRLREELAAKGISEDSIDVVVLSHLHFDHAGGLLTSFDQQPFQLLFPKARYIVAARQWERALHPHMRDRASFIPVLNELLAESGRLDLIEEEGPCSLHPRLSFSFSDGHTPGMLISTIDRSFGGPLAFVGDLVPGSPWILPTITMGYDRFPECLIEEKKALLDRISRTGGSIFFSHDPELPCGKLVAGEKGHEVVPDNLSAERAPAPKAAYGVLHS